MGRMAWSCGATVLLASIGSCLAATLESIHWSSSNTKFNPDQGLVLYPQIGDKVDIVCPRSDGSPGTKEEYHRVYMVSKSQMESCTVDKTDMLLLNCNKPHQDVKYTLKFQEFSPNLWGLEFLRGRDYYITSTSTGFLQGLDNTKGGACRTKSMKLVLRIGQSPSDPLSTLQESPTRFPPTRTKSKDPSAKEKDLKDRGLGAGHPGGTEGPVSGTLVWVISGCVVLLLVIVVVAVALWRYHRRHCVPETQQSAPISLNTLAAPKRDSISSDNNGSDRSDVVFPLRASDSMICRHYERVSCDYGPPVYIVQEIAPQNPTNVYYKV
ncbi:ephrin-B2a-like isoform X1 [Takifugu rubripes]|uniref:Ephrin-B2a-like n=1 Tax=Takifugu rubripes TaxID=31033 RepID=H2V4L3_TAKRU|nr:ephrin-B2a-like isoform X1 [Takifugu rubripes]